VYRYEYIHNGYNTYQIQKRDWSCHSIIVRSIVHVVYRQHYVSLTNGKCINVIAFSLTEDDGFVLVSAISAHIWLCTFVLWHLTLVGTIVTGASAYSRWRSCGAWHSGAFVGSRARIAYRVISRVWTRSWRLTYTIRVVWHEVLENMVCQNVGA
jgi:hypothetical protein